MLTVKHKSPDGARFWETDSVQYIAPSVNRAAAEQVQFHPAGSTDCLEVLITGSIYIMNENGKTVQQYHFPNPEYVGKVANTSLEEAA